MDAKLQQLVSGRARSACEYCRHPQGLTIAPFQIDHIIAIKHRGKTTPENLALSCFYCNSHKARASRESIPKRTKSSASSILEGIDGMSISNGMGRCCTA